MGEAVAALGTVVLAGGILFLLMKVGDIVKDTTREVKGKIKEEELLARLDKLRDQAISYANRKYSRDKRYGIYFLGNEFNSGDWNELFWREINYTDTEP